MKARFWWDANDPPHTFPRGMANYTATMMDTIYAICVEEAENVQAFMRLNAVWKDSCMPGREYLKARAIRDDAAYLIGIEAYYDHELYLSRCPQPPFPFGIAHETYTFEKAGVISIILPRRQNTVLGNEAPRIWDRIRALFL